MVHIYYTFNYIFMYKVWTSKYLLVILFPARVFNIYLLVSPSSHLSLLIFASVPCHVTCRNIHTFIVGKFNRLSLRDLLLHITIRFSLPELFHKIVKPDMNSSLRKIKSKRRLVPFTCFQFPSFAAKQNLVF